MNEATAREGHMTPEETAAWVTELRLAQGLPVRIENANTLAHVAILMRGSSRE